MILNWERGDTCRARGWHKWLGNIRNPETYHVWRKCRTCGGWEYVRPGRGAIPDDRGDPPADGFVAVLADSLPGRNRNPRGRA